jgi:2-polyprenyl-3-methyl-5-hydroxy-6-metoxy-1,4-benzoquinol methylase
MGEKSTLFDKTANDFASSADRQIDLGRYRRGSLFLSAATQSVPSGGYILDYGCGPGRISALLGRQGFRVLGIDPSPEMIAVAKKQNVELLPVEFRVFETCQLETGEAMFDAIVCSSVIEYEARPEELLSRFFAALRPTGVLIISFANSRSISRALFQRRNLHLAAQQHTWSWSQFKELLEEGGFSPLRSTVYFESFFDRIAPLRFLSAWQYAGALGLVVAVKK